MRPLLLKVMVNKNIIFSEIVTLMQHSFKNIDFHLLNEVLTELQTALTGMMRMHEVYVRVTNARLEAMEAQIKAAVGTPATPKDPNAPGVEL